MTACGGVCYQVRTNLDSAFDAKFSGVEYGDILVSSRSVDEQVEVYGKRWNFLH